MNEMQIKMIVCHAVVLQHLYGRTVSFNEAGLHWMHTDLARMYRERHPF